MTPKMSTIIFIFFLCLFLSQIFDVRRLNPLRGIIDLPQKIVRVRSEPQSIRVQHKANFFLHLLIGVEVVGVLMRSGKVSSVSVNGFPVKRPNRAASRVLLDGLDGRA
jgi:hypothetical protein